MIFLPMHVTCKNNQRKHWAVKARETKAERSSTYILVKLMKNRPPFPVKVTLTRCAPRKLDKWNLGSAFKAVIDGVADAYGVDDGDDRWEFVFKQRKQKECGVEIEIEEAEQGGKHGSQV